MPVTSTPRDPRSVVTPDAFELSPDLLGLRLAPPRKRLAALFVDLVVIGIITAVTQSFALILGVVIAVLFVRAGFKRTPVRASVFDRAMRASVGCLGVLVAIATAVLWAAFGIGGGRDRAITVTTESDPTPSGVPGALVEAAEPIESRDVAAIRDGVSLYTTTEALEAYAALLRREQQGETDLVLREALENRLVVDMAADTMLTLQERVADLADEVADQTRELERAEARLEEATGGGLFGTLRDFVDELGFGFGWASLYMTVMLSWWKGQTLGKKLLGIRVLRLDGGPITWWVAFERAGGYAAGFATGLLGFAQIFWDANRQAIHDRIVGTVVVLDGVPKALDWESAP